MQLIDYQCYFHTASKSKSLRLSYHIRNFAIGLIFAQILGKGGASAEIIIFIFFAAENLQNKIYRLSLYREPIYRRAIYHMKTNSAALTEAIYYILLAVQEPIHGYGIMQKTSSMSNGRLILSAGTLYGAISNLLEKGWITPCGESTEGDGRRKMYQITDLGQEVLQAEYNRLKELVENGTNNIKNVQK
jgi:DNA-binding PadR family transcriptional regulator